MPDTLKSLDQQACQWYEGLPDNLKLKTKRLHDVDGSLNITYAQVFLFTRYSHLRNLNYRLVLSSSSCISQHGELVAAAISIAKELIRVLFDLFEKTEFVRFEPIFFKHVWLIAFGNLLLAVVNSGPQVWDGLRAEFDVALDLIQALSDRSAPLMRLWNRLRGLRELSARLFQPRGPNADGGEEPEISGSGNEYESVSSEDFFPEALECAGQYEVLNWTREFSISSDIRADVSSLLDAPFGPCAIFDFPYAGWVDRI